MQIKIQITQDGSKTLFLPEMNETYHSKFGAKTESMHVFINAGYKKMVSPNINILEVGMGTGLNVLLTFQEHLHDFKQVYYETIEKFPVQSNVFSELDYATNDVEQLIFSTIHTASWDEDILLDDTFILHKKQTDLLNFSSKKRFDLIYFDAFDPEKQPELWTESVFASLFDYLNEGGVLVTYSAKGIVRRAMQAVGFTVERIPGPPGKREMMRATKHK